MNGPPSIHELAELRAVEEIVRRERNQPGTWEAHPPEDNCSCGSGMKARRCRRCVKVEAIDVPAFHSAELASLLALAAAASFRR